LDFEENLKKISSACAALNDEKSVELSIAQTFSDLFF
jgi:hypothetical protein